MEGWLGGGLELEAGGWRGSRAVIPGRNGVKSEPAAGVSGHRGGRAIEGGCCRDDEMTSTVYWSASGLNRTVICLKIGMTKSVVERRMHESGVTLAH